MKSVNKTCCFLIIVLLIGFSACKNDKNEPTNSFQFPKAQTLQNDSVSVGNDFKITIDESKFNAAVVDEFSLLNAFIENDSLKVQIQYGGGCGVAKFELITNGLYMESNPVQLNVLLSFVDEDDCEAAITKWVCFDLSNLAGHYKNAYQVSDGTIIIHLQNHEPDLTYSF